MKRIAFLRYVGAKHRTAPAILERLYATGKPMLVEVFGGSAAIMLNSTFRKRVYNDADGDLVNLFRVMADRPRRQELLRILRWHPPSRRIYDEDYALYVRGGFSFSAIADPVDRARATFFRMSFCFGGKIRSGGFQITANDRAEIKELLRYRNVLRNFASIGQFFHGTVIENLHYQDAIRIYGENRATVLFVDPPYMGTEDYYSHPFTTGDHVFLAQQLLTTPAPVVCTFYEHPLVTQLYPESHWWYERFEATKNSANMIPGSKKIKVAELILTRKT